MHFHSLKKVPSGRVVPGGVPHKLLLPAMADALRSRRKGKYSSRMMAGFEDWMLVTPVGKIK